MFFSVKVQPNLNQTIIEYFVMVLHSRFIKQLRLIYITELYYLLLCCILAVENNQFFQQTYLRTFIEHFAVNFI